MYMYTPKAELFNDCPSFELLNSTAPIGRFTWFFFMAFVMPFDVIVIISETTKILWNYLKRPWPKSINWQNGSGVSHKKRSACNLMLKLNRPSDTLNNKNEIYSSLSLLTIPLDAP
uniref:Uncharacterized protein n=1 Tax=Glossina brevipalpis TaxID=37001 RepID=A0A1A9WXU5_9MUSC